LAGHGAVEPYAVACAGRWAGLEEGPTGGCEAAAIDGLKNLWHFESGLWKAWGFATLCRRLLSDHRRYKSSRRAKSSRAIRLAPRKQKLIGNPVPTRRRRGQPWTRKALLDDANLCFFRPSTASTRVNNLKTTDRTTVSKDISVPTVSHITSNSTRRPTPDEYGSFCVCS
jgi:hypothetical protein